MSIKVNSSSQTNYISGQKSQNINFCATTGSLERTPQDDIVEKQGLSTGAKVALGTVALTGVLALVDVVANDARNLKKIWGKLKGKSPKASGGEVTGTAAASHAGTSSSVTEMAETTFKNGKAYNSKGELFTGTISKTSNSGSKLDSHYVDGVVVKREFTPIKQDSIKKVVKTYDNHSFPGFRAARGEILKPDGSKEYSFNAFMTQREFPPEIESKIKLKDFFATDLSKIESKTVDLGDDLTLVYDAIGCSPEITLLKKGKAIARKDVLFDDYTYDLGDIRVRYNKGKKWDELVDFSFPEGHKTYFADGNWSLSKTWRITDEGTRQYMPKEQQVVEYYDALGKLLRTEPYQ